MIIAVDFDGNGRRAYVDWPEVEHMLEKRGIL